MNKLTIAFLSRDLPSRHPNGASCQVHLLANALCDRGHCITVFSRDPAPVDALYSVVQDSPKAGAWNRLVRPALCFARQNYNAFDLVHAHGDDYLLRTKKPLVRTFYGSALWEALYDRRPLYRLRQAAFYALEWISLAKCSTSAGISRISQRALPGVKTVVPCAADRRFFGIQGAKTAEPSLLFVGTVGGRKRGDLLLQVFRREVQPRFPNAQLILATSSTGISGPGIQVRPRPDMDELARLYRQAWVVCSASTYEGFGVPIIEAWACGTAVVSTPHHGALELIRNECDGLLASPGRYGAALNRLLDNEALREKLAAAGRDRARDFEPPRIAAQYERIYDALLQ